MTRTEARLRAQLADAEQQIEFLESQIAKVNALVVEWHERPYGVIAYDLAARAVADQLCRTRT